MHYVYVLGRRFYVYNNNNKESIKNQKNKSETEILQAKTQLTKPSPTFYSLPRCSSLFHVL